MTSPTDNLGLPSHQNDGIGSRLPRTSTPTAETSPISSHEAAINEQNAITAQVLELLKGSDRNLKLERPETFQGHGRATDVTDNWLFKMERYLILSQITPRLKTIYASQYLSGNAQEWYRNVAGSQLSCPEDNWDEFKTVLRYCFADVNSDAKILEQFFTITQATTRTKTLREYIEQFSKLWTVVHTEVSETVAIQRFMQGLQPRTRSDVLRSRPTTLSDAIQFADGAEGINVTYLTHRSPQYQRGRPPVSPLASGSRRTDGTDSYYGPGPMELSNIGGRSGNNYLYSLSFLGYFPLVIL